MKKALALARRGIGRVHPNPMVGAVLVKNNQVTGKGFHERFGAPHAEVNAIRQAKGQSRGSTLYVTLEPCAHYGKTPPCADFIIQNKIKEVVIGASDPNPLVSGKGIRRLKKAGVRVRTGILRKECETLNRDFNYWILKKMPYVIVKAAQSLDGKIATKTGESRWISGALSRKFARTLRAESDAVLVGANTIIRDDPRLTVRGLKYVCQPVKVILDSRLRVSPTARIFSGAPQGVVIIAVTKKADKHRKEKFKGKAEIVIVKEKKGRIDLRSLLLKLARRGIVRVLIEGGGEVIGEAFSENCVQEIYFFVTNKIIGGRLAVNSVAGEGISRLKDAVTIRQLTLTRIGEDFMVHGKI